MANVSTNVSAPGQIPAPSPLTGSEVISVNNGPAWVGVTTAQIAALASVGGTDVQTSITTVGDGVLTAAAMTGGLISRSGPVAAFTDTTATAVQLAALGQVGGSFYVAVKNLTPFTETLAAGVGVTFSLVSTVIPGNSVGTFLVVVNSATAATMYHVDTTNLSIQNTEATTALTTVGAGTITAAGIASKVTLRSGSQSGTPFTDTTGIAADIITAQANAHIGISWEYTYVNNTNAVATLTGGTGVTVSGVTVVPANAWAKYLVTYTAAATITMVGIEQGYFAHSGTFANNGTSTVTTADANVTAGSNIVITLKTVGGTVGAIPHLLTVTPGTGFATVGTASDTSTYSYTILG